MMFDRLTVIMVVWGCFMFSEGRCQQQPPEIIPASPNAAALGKYGSIPVSLYTGTADITVPLYELKSGDIKVPISLSYHTGGIRLSELAGWVGLGFVLNAGGVITRDMKSYDDFRSMAPYTTPSVAPEVISKGRPLKLVSHFYPTANNVLVSSKGEEFDFNAVDESVEGYDFEYDVFSYNFMGKTGRFIFTHSGVAVLEKDDDLLVEHDGNDNLKITDEAGFVYYFNAVERIFQGGPGGTSPVISWYLSRIESLKGYVVDFRYDPTTRAQPPQVHDFDGRGCEGAMSSITYSGISYSNALVLSQIVFDNGVVDFTQDNLREDYPGQRITGMKVTSVASGKVLKQYRFTYSYFALVDKRLRLDSVNEVSTTYIPPYTFTYEDPAGRSYNPESLHLTSNSFDHWGYYSGYNNNPQQFLPAFNGTIEIGNGTESLNLPGANRDASDKANVFTLRSINYPTGGRTEFITETNTYEYSQNQLSSNPVRELVTKTLSVSWGESGAGSGVVEIPQAVGKVRATVSFRCGQNDGCDKAKDSTAYGDVWFTLQGLRREIHGNLICPEGSPVCSDVVQLLDPGMVYHWEAFIGEKAKAKYISELRCLFEWEEEKVTFSDNDNKYQYGGGVRIAQITDFNESNVIVRAKRYFYDYSADGNDDGVPEGHSYGKRTAAPRYTRYHVKAYQEGGGVGGNGYVSYCRSFQRYANSITPLGTIGYDRVIEMTDDYTHRSPASMKSVYVFENVADSVYQYVLQPGDLNGLDAVVTNLQPFGVANIANKKNGLLKQQVDYAYLGPGKGYKAIRTVTNEWKNTILNNYYSVLFESLELVGTNSKLCYVYPSLRSERVVLANTTEILYNTNNEAAVTTYDQFEYGKTHNQQVRHIRQESSGRTVAEFKIYPPDYAGLTTTASGIKTLLGKHVIGSPVEEYVAVRETPSSPYKVQKANLTTYKADQPFPDVVYRMERAAAPLLSDFVLSNSVSGSFSKDSSYKPALQFISYSPRGNVKQMAKDNNVNFAYKWQYNENYPTVECKNCAADKFLYEGFEETTANVTSEARTGNKSFTSVYTVVLPGAGSYTLTYWKKSGTEPWKLVQVNNVTTSQSIGGSGVYIDDVRLVPAGGAMTTYTYNPLEGMTSMTDANNVIVYYEYDDLQRLSVVRDQDGNIVKRYTYNYLVK